MQSPYYARYDQVYEQVYEQVCRQGFRDWWYGPERAAVAELRAGVMSRIHEARAVPRGATVVEFGCGEARWAADLAQLGMRYLGLDLSPHVIARAREQTVWDGPDIEFRVADLLDLDEELASRKFDLVLDQACLHMFVVDEDRRRYLRNVRQVMAGGGAFILLLQSLDEAAYDGEIQSIEEFQDITGQDLAARREFDAWDGESYQRVLLPRFAVRSKTRKGYLAELEQAGFQVSRAYLDATSKGNIDIILTA